MYSPRARPPHAAARYRPLRAVSSNTATSVRCAFKVAPMCIRTHWHAHDTVQHTHLGNLNPVCSPPAEERNGISMRVYNSCCYSNTHACTLYMLYKYMAEVVRTLPYIGLELIVVMQITNI